MQVLIGRSPRLTTSTKERIFFSGMAILLIAIVMAGFAPTYYLRGAIASRTPVLPLTPLAHVHGVLFSAWALLFVAQTLLISAGRRDVHRRLGYVGIVVLPAMIVVATITALHGALRAAGPPDIPPLPFLAIPLLDVPVFGLLISLALWKRADGPTHKRLMLVAMIGMMGPALSRLPLPGNIPQPAFILAAITALLSALIAWDIIARGRPHKTTLWSSGFVLISLIFRGAVMNTQIWLGFASWAVALIR